TAMKGNHQAPSVNTAPRLLAATPIARTIVPASDHKRTRRLWRSIPVDRAASVAFTGHHRFRNIEIPDIGNIIERLHGNHLPTGSAQFFRERWTLSRAEALTITKTRSGLDDKCHREHIARRLAQQKIDGSRLR